MEHPKYFAYLESKTIMTELPVMRLINTLSGSEKRYFKLHTKKQTGNKDYLQLFDIIEKSKSADIAVIKQTFLQKCPKASLDNTARYLIKLLTDCLIQAKMDKDVFFQSIQGILRARILQERTLTDESYKELKKVKQVSNQYQLHFVEYLAYRNELNYFSDSSFMGISDEKLIKTQMKAKDVLKSLNHIQDHYSLFEILKYRLLYSGKVSSDDEKKRLNDLMLSEMVLVAGRGKNSFASQKLHLLFQSFFFTHISDHESALKTFHQLTKLFQENEDLLDHPPLDYLSVLTGILESLHMLEKYTDMNFYMEKLRLLDRVIYPEYFRFLVRKTIAVYHLAILVSHKNFMEAKQFVQELEPDLLKAYKLIDEEKQWELFFYCSLACFATGDLKKAHHYLREIMHNNKLYPQLIICKAAKLLDILIYMEKGDLDYLEYEIRSYKRFFKQHNPLLKSETLILKIIENKSVSKNKKNIMELDRLQNELSNLKRDKYGKRLLKYFDFAEWLKIKN